MNANSKQPAPTIKSWLQHATEQLSAKSIPTARLDAELLLAYVLDVNRTWLIAHQNDSIDDLNVLENASKALEKRMHRTPLAYITNQKEFYNRSFYVDERVLIPRPESEAIIDCVKELLKASAEDVAEGQPNATGAEPRKVASEETRSRSFTLLDTGTGSGCLGITAKLEHPELSVTLADISPDALAVARKNTELLRADIDGFVQSDLLSHWIHQPRQQQFDIIVANLPYVDEEWERSPETDHEPSIALFAIDHGMELIKKCMHQASILTSVCGYLILESDPVQHADIVSLGDSIGFALDTIDGYIVCLRKA